MIFDSISYLRLFARKLTGRPLDACDMLVSEHLKVRVAFGRLRVTRDRKGRRAIFEKQIKPWLERHTELEESVFYPACEKIEALKPQVLEAIEEHKQVKTLLAEIASLADDSSKWNPKVWLLIENVEHHVSEEENDLFPLVRRCFDSEELLELGREMKHHGKVQSPRKKKTAA